MNQIDNIAKFVASLDAEGREALSTHMAYQSKFGAGTPDANPHTPLNAIEAIYWEVISLALREMLVTNVGPSAFNYIGNKRLSRRRFAECAKALYDYTTYGCGVQLSSTHRRAIMVETLRCLIKLMQRHNRNDDYITLITVCERIGELHQAVEKAYPGYVQARLLHMVVPTPT